MRDVEPARTCGSPEVFMNGTTRTLIACLAVLAMTAAQAQATTTVPLPSGAADALAEGEALMAEALAAYPAQYPDRPLWQAAFEAGQRGVSLAPDRIEPIRFLAEAYSRSSWYGPAWTQWLEYVRRGGRDVLEGDDDARELIARVGHELGYGAYTRQDAELALDYFRTIVDLVPEDVNAHVWSGRILIETERPQQAIPYWRRVTELDPADDRAAYFLGLAQEQTRWGTRAVNAFREGVAYYEGGRMSEAEERFARAATLNPDYVDAWAWQARVTFERGEYRQAADLYGRALSLDPGNATFTYFRDEALRRLGQGAAPDEEVAGTD
jgi:tetratricopeptide (TPR) repeat protein